MTLISDNDLNKLISLTNDYCDELQSTNELAIAFCDSNNMSLKDSIEIVKFDTTNFDTYTHYHRNTPPELRSIMSKGIQELASKL